MAEFTITIPGVGDITVDGPFATEDSIRKLANAISKAEKSTSGKNKKTDDFSKIFDDLDDSVNDTSGALSKLIREANDDAKSFKNLNAGLKNSINGLKGLMAGAQSVQGGFGKMIENMGSGVSDFAGLIPGIGTAAGVLVTAFTGVASAVIGMIQGLEETNDKLMGAGALFKGGIDEFQANARDGGLAMSSLTKSIIDNAASYRMLTGGLTGGTKTITQAFKKLGPVQQEILYNMGYTSDEVLSGMTDFAAMAKLSGQDLNMEQVAKGGADYLKVQRELTRLTGKSADELKRQREAMRSQAEFQAFFNNIANPKLRASVENGMLAVPDATKEMVSKLLRGTPLTDPAMLQLLNRIPGIEDDFIELGKSARDGTISGEEYTKRFNDTMNKLNLSSKNLIEKDKMVGLNADLYKESNPVLARLIEMLQAGSDQATSFNEALKSSTAVMDLVNGPQGIMSQALGIFRKYDEQISRIVQTFGATVTKLFGIRGEGVFKKILDDLLEFSMDVTGAIDTWASDTTGKETFGKLWENVWESFKKNFGDIFSTTTGFIQGWLSYLSDAISSGIQKGFDAVLASLGYETDTKEQSDVVEALNKLPENMRDVIQAPEALSPTQLAKLSPSQRKLRQQQMETYNLMTEVDNPEQMDFKLVEDPWFGTKKWRRLTDAEKAINQGQNINNIPIDPSIVNRATPNALGGMYEPKPGGHIVRVAEALQPEIIAPAKRGSDGKMGLEVSGVMLDNSKLLQNLVKINEGQAALISGLNSKMENMTVTMEKLVYEQRQANRLAV